MNGLKILVFLLPLGVFGQSMYTIQDLGTLPNFPSCTATAISQSGNVTGYCTPAGGSILLGTNTRGFIYSNGKMTDLGQATSAVALVPTGVNDAGLVVGGYVDINLLKGVSLAPFIYQNGSIQQYTGIPPNCGPFGLNNAGQSAATQVLAGGFNFFVESQAFELTAGSGAMGLPPVKASQGVAFGISSANNWIAGASAAVASSVVGLITPTLWHNGVAQTLPAVPGFNDATATGVNQSGMATGMGFTFNFSEIQDGNATGHALLFNNGAVTDLGTLPGDKTSAGVGINNSGSIVGFSTSQPPDISLFTAGLLEPALSNSHAFVYANGTMIDLTRQLPNGTGWQLSSASAINDAGQIAGTGIIKQQQHAFLLTPVTPPQLNSLVGAGLSVPAVNNLAPNAMFTLFGTGFADASLKRNVTSADLTNNALPTNLGNVCVQGGAAQWGLIYVSATQINAVANPLSTSGSVPVSVITNCGLPNQTATAAVNVPLASEAPQFFYVQSPS